MDPRIAVLALTLSSEQLFKKTKFVFVASANSEKSFPQPHLPEVAFIGGECNILQHFRGLLNRQGVRMWENPL